MAEHSVTTTRANYDDYEWSHSHLHSHVSNRCSLWDRVSSDEGEESGSNDEAHVSAGAVGVEEDIDEDDSGNVADDEEESS